MKYALVLAGGGTRGAFEAGVLKALKELGINIAAVCGTSIGAINGALFVSNADTEQLWTNIALSDIAPLECNSANLLSPAPLAEILKNRKGLDISQLKNLISANISEKKIRRSHILYGLCTYNIDQKKTVELFIDEIPRGLLTEYITASACFPGFEPVKINGEYFTDGGVQNNLPIDMLINKGFDTIISVSVKGMGFVRDINRCGINIIDINCTTPFVGLMEFDNAGIKKSIMHGYISCMKKFGRLRGTHYAFDIKSYDDAVSIYGTQFLDNIEITAKELKINPCRIYSVETLVRRILEEYRLNPQLEQLTSIIKNNKNGLLHHMLDMLRRTFNSANTIVYLSKHSDFEQKT